jgi:hypothetical protein
VGNVAFRIERFHPDIFFCALWSLKRAARRLIPNLSADGTAAATAEGYTPPDVAHFLADGRTEQDWDFELNGRSLYW